MVGASKAQRARLETCVSAESNAVIVGLRSSALPFKEIAVGWYLFRPTPNRSRSADLCCRHEGIPPQGSRLFNTGHRSTRPRDFRE